MAGPGPGLPQPSRPLAGQLDLDRDPAGQRVDVLAVQPGAGLQVGGVGELDGGVGDMALAGFPAQLPLAEPATALGDAWLDGEPHDADGVDVGELGNDEGPGPHVQADQSQRPGRGGDPGGPGAGRGRSGRGPPSGQGSDAGSPRPTPGDARRAGDSRPATQHVGAGGVLLAQRAQRNDVTGGDASVGVPARTPGAAAWGWPAAGAVDVRAGPCAASPKEALLGHGGTSDGGERCRDAATSRPRDGQ